MGTWQTLKNIFDSVKPTVVISLLEAEMPLGIGDWEKFWALKNNKCNQIYLNVKLVYFLVAI